MAINAGFRRQLVAVGLSVAAIVAVAALVDGAQRAHAADTAKPVGPAVPVTIGTVTKADVSIRMTGTGSVLASQSVLVKVRVDGQLDKVLFTEGQDVKAGQVLALIDPRPLQAALESAQAQKAHDEALLAAALKDLDRYTTLVAQDSVPVQTLDTQRATVGTLRPWTTPRSSSATPRYVHRSMAAPAYASSTPATSSTPLTPRAWW
jgi:multidrug efflux system membrane fusion protein